MYSFSLPSQSQKYWRCRYLLLPYESPKFGEGEQAATREAQQLIANFVCFMDFLNHIKRTPQAATASLRGGPLVCTHNLLMTVLNFQSLHESFNMQNATSQLITVGLVLIA